MPPVWLCPLPGAVAILRKVWNRRTLCSVWCSWQPAWRCPVRHVAAVDAAAAHLVASLAAGAANTAASRRRPAADDAWSAVRQCTRRWRCQSCRHRHRRRCRQRSNHMWPAIRVNSRRHRHRRAMAMHQLRARARTMPMPRHCPPAPSTTPSRPRPWALDQVSGAARQLFNGQR